MRLTKAEMDGEYGGLVRRQMAQIRGLIKGRGATPPVFTVNGPRTLDAMVRLKGRVSSGQGSHACMGTERFALTDIFLKGHANGDQEVRMLFTPTTAADAARVMNVTISMTEACETFEGIEAWMAALPPLPKKPEPAGVPRDLPPPIESVDENPLSGYW